MTLPERFWSKVEKAEGCWLWTAYRDDDGYGSIRVGRKAELAHRVAWWLTNGPIPPGLHVLHRCDRPECVNPDHLFLGTQLDNVVDMYRKGRARAYQAAWAVKAAKTHCVRGHLLSGPNLYIRPDGRGRECRECKHPKAA